MLPAQKSPVSHGCFPALPWLRSCWALGALLLPDAVGPSWPSALPRLPQVFHVFSWFCLATIKSLWRRRALRAIPAGKDTSIRRASAASRGDSVALGLRCLVLGCLRILKLSLIIAQNRTNNISRARRTPPCGSAGLCWQARRCAGMRCVLAASGTETLEEPLGGGFWLVVLLLWVVRPLRLPVCIFTGVFSPLLPRPLSGELGGRRWRRCDSGRASARPREGRGVLR